MTAPLASLALAFGAFALLQALGRGQPLWGHPAAKALRALAVVALLGAARVSARALGGGEAILFTLLAFTAGASLFVPLAALRPRWAWRAAVAAPLLGLALLLTSRSGR